MAAVVVTPRGYGLGLWKIQARVRRVFQSPPGYLQRPRGRDRVCDCRREVYDGFDCRQRSHQYRSS